MLKLISKTDHSGLREFALTMSWAFPLVFMLILPWLFELGIPWWPAVLSLILVLLRWLYVPAIYYPYWLWMHMAMVLGWINTRIILGLAFFLLIWPIGLLMRLVGKLQYQPQRQKNQTSYWIPSDELKPENLKEPF